VRAERCRREMGAKWARFGLEPIWFPDILPAYLHLASHRGLPAKEFEMTTCTRTSRIRRASMIIAGAAAVGAVVAPAAAFANTYTGQFLGPGQSACISQYAAYQVRIDTTATARGAKFRLYRNGSQVAASPTPTTTAWSAEYRTAFGNFPGPGDYSLCAVNSGTTNTFVTLRVRSDGEI
jgi:hypothetical protein